MKYDPTRKAFLIPEEDLRVAAASLRYAMRHIPDDRLVKLEDLSC